MVGSLLHNSLKYGQQTNAICIENVSNGSVRHHISKPNKGSESNV